MKIDCPPPYKEVLKDIILLRVDSVHSFLEALHAVVCMHKLRVGNWC